MERPRVSTDGLREVATSAFNAWVTIPFLSDSFQVLPVDERNYLHIASIRNHKLRFLSALNDGDNSVNPDNYRDYRCYTVKQQGLAQEAE